MDLNKDGVLQKNEIIRFVRKFLGTPLSELDVIIDTVNSIWYKFDIDRSGYLSRAETLRFLNDYLTDIGKQKASLQIFNRYFNELDVNGDNVISREEMA